MDVPEVETSRGVSMEECRQAYTKHTFKASDGKVLKVEPGEELLYQFVEDGSITVLGYNTYCKGVNLPLHHTQIAEQSLVLTQVRFTLDKEVFLRTKDGKMLARQRRQALPEECFWQDAGCVDNGIAYSFDKGTISCPYKMVRTVQLQRLQNNRRIWIDDELGLFFNTTLTRKLKLKGCPIINITYTTYEGIYITTSPEAKELSTVKSLNLHEDVSLGPTLEYFHYRNSLLVKSLIRRQQTGDCQAWLEIGNTRDHPHPTLQQRGLFTRRIGPVVHEYQCKSIHIPMVELDHCLVGIPVLMRGELHMIDPDSRVISPHLETQPCESGFPMLMRTVGDNPIWVQISRDIIQVKDPAPLIERIQFQESEHMTTLYTREELTAWERFSSFPAVQRTKTQKILNSLCSDGKCEEASMSGNYGRFDLEEIKSHAENVGKEILAKMNPLGFINSYWQGFKDMILHLLMLEYLVIILSACIALIKFGLVPTLAALINRLSIDWGRLRAKRGPTPEVRMQRLLDAAENI